MSDRFQPVKMEDLASWVFGELEKNNSIFGIPRELFFVPQPADPVSVSVYNRRIETPFGVAAGPHSQMAQNIIAAWLCGARFIELKTVQTLDEIEVSKPCIDMQDEGFNVEWSQELKVEQSFDEYVRAWVLIHALHRKLGFPGDQPGVIFNMSVGYNMEGLLKPNMQWYLRSMRDAGELKNRYVDMVAGFFPEIAEIAVPEQVSDNVTLSTMHGCPPEEIEKISAYLIEEWGLHTNVKLNPTLLGPSALRRILNIELGYRDVAVPDEAFEHDLKYEAAAPMLKRLSAAARGKNVHFGVKLSNTLEVENHRSVFNEKERRMYMSGRPLHALTVNLAAKLADEFKGELPMSFSGGADAFNVIQLLGCGMKTVTTCSDILRTGGYLRLLQYVENTAEQLRKTRAADIPDYVCKSARKMKGFDEEFDRRLYELVRDDDELNMTKTACRELSRFIIRSRSTSRITSVVRGWAGELAMTESANRVMSHVVRACALMNLKQYAATVCKERALLKDSFSRDKSKTNRPLGSFDCIAAPCTQTCPVNQKVPRYMKLVSEGRHDEAVEVVREDNSLGAVLGRACNHLCENTCIRTHLDEPLAIREIKRFIMDREAEPAPVKPAAARNVKVAVIGGGPCGLSVARHLVPRGYEVCVFEARENAGGMVSGTIPAYRATQAVIDQDMRFLKSLGVEVRFGMQAGRDFTLADLRSQGFKYIVLAVGAQNGKRLGLEGEEATGVIDALEFLRAAREKSAPPLGKRVAVIGGGDVAMDCARSAWRIGDGKVSILYRRTIDQMPAAREEIEGVLAEGIRITELVKPTRVISKNGKLTGLECLRVKLGDKDSSGRRSPVDVPRSEFTIPLDSLIVAISQEPLLDFAGGEKLELTRQGFVKTDPKTFETSVANVFAGGDVALNGPDSIVRALGDGRAIAESIRSREEGPSPAEPAVAVASNRVDLMRRRAHRAFRVNIPRIAGNRKNFEEVTLTLSEAAAKEEASRCLDCSLMCSVCVSVCPNKAFMTYTAAPFSAALPEILMRNGQVVLENEHVFEVTQQYQVAVLTDFCNECGNCATFCPSSGRPYRDKPRLYLTRPEFEAESDNAYMIFHEGEEWRIKARSAGATLELRLGEELVFTSDKFSARIDPATFGFKEVTASGLTENERVVPVEAATMYVLLRSLRASMPYLPGARE